LKGTLSLSRIKKVDRNEVYKAYRNWPALAMEGFSAKVELPSGGFSRAFVLGMGGSAAGGDIIAGWMSALDGHELAVLKGSVPVHDMRGTLAIACSASGGTRETVEMMKTASERGATIVSISSGGDLLEESRRLGAAQITMPKVVAPRYMLPFMIFSSLKVLNEALGLGCEEEADEAIRTMEREQATLDVETPSGRNPAKRLAGRLARTTPVVFSDEVARGVAFRFKSAMNENAKRHAFFDTMPDLFHNEVQAWEDPTKVFTPIFLRHSWEGSFDSKKTSAWFKILQRRGNKPIEIRGLGSGRLSQLVSMAYQLDMASYYTAMILGRDPLPTLTLDGLKRL
jgi:glucose/mannose-6-phosphate isomerase